MFKFMLQLCFVALSPEASTIERKSGEPENPKAKAEEIGTGAWSL